MPRDGSRAPEGVRFSRSPPLCQPTGQLSVVTLLSVPSWADAVSPGEGAAAYGNAINPNSICECPRSVFRLN